MGIFDSIFGASDPLAPSNSRWGAWSNKLDPLGERYSYKSWISPKYTYGNDPGGSSFDPVQTGAMWDVPAIALGFKSTTSGINNWLDYSHPRLNSFQDVNLPSNPGEITSPGGDWAMVDRWDRDVLNAINKVQRDTGVYVPVNLVKSIMRRESGGFSLAKNNSNAVGLMQLTPNAYGNYDYNLLSTDDSYNIYAGVNDLALRYRDKFGLPSDQTEPSWEWAAKGYLGFGGQDDYGTDAGSYWRDVSNYWSELNTGKGDSVDGGGVAFPGTTAFSAIWKGFDAPITQGFGWTEFALNSDYAKTAYGYTADYTRDGQPMGHAGVDVGLAYGTPLFSSLGGVVVNAGGTSYYCDGDGNGCGPGVGELRIRVNGTDDEFILGHMSQITVKPGDVITPGQAVGYSGSENGGHVHVEYRRWVGKPITGSGYEVVDPFKAMDGVFVGSYGQTGGGPDRAAGANDWASFMRNAAQGKPLTGVASQGGFHDYLRTVMGIGTAPRVDEYKDDPTWIWNSGILNNNSTLGPH